MVLILGLAILLAALALAAVFRPVPVADVPVPDPHEGEVRAFRRDLYDWLRGG